MTNTRGLIVPVVGLVVGGLLLATGSWIGWVIVGAGGVAFGAWMRSNG